jgi:hypothetical protein
MKRIHPSFFMHLERLLETASFKTQLPVNEYAKDQFTPGHPMELMSKEYQGQWGEILEVWETDCRELELVASLATVQRMRELVAKPTCEYKEVGTLARELDGRLNDEMTGRYCWALSMKEEEYYECWRKGWERIIGRFPDTVGDIEEAQKCFAFSRYPATVFHSIQVVEVGLIELGKFINVADPKSGWTAVANELKKIVSRKREDLSDFEKHHFQFIEQVQGTVEALKNAWRNKVSHVQGKIVLMTSDFSPEVAEEILFASRAFMRRLAEGIPPANEKVI